MKVRVPRVQSLPPDRARGNPGSSPGRSRATKSKTYRPKDLQKNPDLFPEGSDAWMALNAGHSIKLDDQGFIVDVWDKNGHYDVATGEQLAPSHECGAVTKKDGNPLCQRKVKGKTEYCWQHR